MAIHVEFYGLARQRAGTAELSVHLDPDVASLRDVLAAVCERLPVLGQELLKDGRLHPALAANLDGQRFISDPVTPIRDGQSLLIFSADAGG